MGAGYLDRINVPWSQEEDEVLRRLVLRHGVGNWSLIGGSIPGRSGKSCRLRWRSQLPPDVEHRPFTAAEDELILQAHAQHGKKWAMIARFLSARNGDAVKNHWNSTLKWKFSPVIRMEDGGSSGHGFRPEKRSASSDSEFSGSRQIDASSEADDPLTRLSLSLPGTESEEPSSREFVCSNPIRLPRRASENSSPEFVALLREMIEEEVRNYQREHWERRRDQSK